MTQLDVPPSDFLKMHRPDFYIASFFTPSDQRNNLLWLYTFDAELSLIAHKVSEPMLGEIRLQWWRDTLENAQKGISSGHPTADHLGQIIKDRKLPFMAISSLIDARSFDVSGAMMSDWSALKVYLNKTYGMLSYLSAFLLTSDRDEAFLKKLELVCAEFAIAYGVTHMLVTLPLQIRTGRIMIPETLLGDHGMTIADLQQGGGGDDLSKFVKTLSQEAKQSYYKVQNLLSECPVDIQSAFLPVTLVPEYLKKLTNGTYAPFYESVSINPLKRLWFYWRASAFGKI